MNKTLVYILLFFAALILLAWFFLDIFIYIAIAIVISSILRPVTNYLSRIQFYGIRIPRLLAVLISFALLVVVITGFIILFIPLVDEQIEVLTNLNYENLYESMMIPIRNLEDALITYGLSREEEGFIADTLKLNIAEIIANIKVSNLLNTVLSFTGSFFIGLLAVSFIAFFLLYEMAPIRRKFISLIPNKYFEVTIAAFNKIERLLSYYLLGLFLQMFSIFALASFGLSILGIKYALTIALFAAVANLVPYLGPILGAAFGIVVGISTGTDLVTTQDFVILFVKIIAVFAGVQIIDNVLLQPLIFSKSVRAHPLEIFLIIFAGATIAGIPGMIAAIPIYTVLRVSVSELYRGYKEYSIFKTQR
ncbi:MAG: AI-2E family transporter [Candidatus Cyclobacteriaceae bacterium M2_1C_046]